jgi:hypothetical protein
MDGLRPVLGAVALCVTLTALPAAAGAPCAARAGLRSW